MRGPVTSHDDTFFTTPNCDRCHKPLVGRTMSWFTDETICRDCWKEEDALKGEMRKAGLDPSDYEGCGYMPNETGGVR